MYSSPADNSQSRPVYALLIATPTVAATRDLVSEHSCSLLFLCINLKETHLAQTNRTLISSAKERITMLQPWSQFNSGEEQKDFFESQMWSFNNSLTYLTVIQHMYNK